MTNERFEVVRTRLSLGGDWHDGYIVRDLDTGRVVRRCLSMTGCSTFAAENEELAKDDPDVYDVPVFDPKTRAWGLLCEGELFEIDEPETWDGCEMWAIGEKTGYDWRFEGEM